MARNGGQKESRRQLKKLTSSEQPKKLNESRLPVRVC